MALIKCPECEKDVSSVAESCPNCGCPIKEYALKRDDEIQRLLDRIKPIKYTFPEPRRKACIKCGKLFSLVGNPFCKCNMPGYDLDLPNVEYEPGEINYIYDVILPDMNIGDPDSDEYKLRVKKNREDDLWLEEMRKTFMQDYKIVATPPNPHKNTNTNYSYTPDPPPTNQPTCPICGSTRLAKISTVKKAAKISLFGIFGAGDLGKTWKCDKCGSKF